MPLGESRFDVCKRVHQAFNTLYADARKHKISDIVVVTHGVTLRAFLMMWLHFTPEWFEKEQNPHNCGIRLIDGNMDKGYIFQGFPPMGHQIKNVIIPEKTMGDSDAEKDKYSNDEKSESIAKSIRIEFNSEKDSKKKEEEKRKEEENQDDPVEEDDPNEDPSFRQVEHAVKMTMKKGAEEVPVSAPSLVKEDGAKELVGRKLRNMADTGLEVSGDFTEFVKSKKTEERAKNEEKNELVQSTEKL